MVPYSVSPYFFIFIFWDEVSLLARLTLSLWSFYNPNNTGSWGMCMSPGSAYLLIWRCLSLSLNTVRPKSLSSLKHCCTLELSLVATSEMKKCLCWWNYVMIWPLMGYRRVLINWSNFINQIAILWRVKTACLINLNQSVSPLFLILIFSSTVIYFSLIGAIKAEIFRNIEVTVCALGIGC